jgi:hypothetical protein
MTSDSTAPGSLERARTLQTDTRGAILILGIVMGALLVGALWHIASLGNAIIWREDLQNAADAAAMDNAVWHARGMNALVGLNIVMSGVLAVLVIWRTILIMVTIALIISTIICVVSIIFAGGGGCGAQAFLMNMETRMLNFEAKRWPDKIIRVLEAMHAAEAAVATATPALAVAESSLQPKAAYHLDSSFAFSMSSIPSPTCGDQLHLCFSKNRGKKPGGATKPGSSTKPGTGGSSGGGVDLSKGGGSGKGGSSGGGVDLGKGGTSGGGVDLGKGGTSGSGVDLSKGGTSGSGVDLSKGGSGGASSETPEEKCPPKSFCGIQSASYETFREFVVNPRVGYVVSLPAQNDAFALLCEKAGGFVFTQIGGLLNHLHEGSGDAMNEAGKMVGRITGQFPGVFCEPASQGAQALKDTIFKELGDRTKKHCEDEWDKKNKDDKTKPGETACKPRAQCCKVCDGGMACGDTCISRALTCHKGAGCACDSSDVCKDEPGGTDEKKDDAARDKFIKECIEDRDKKTKVQLDKSVPKETAEAETCEDPGMDCSRPVKVWEWAANGNLFMRSFATVAKDAKLKGIGDRGIEVASMSKARATALDLERVDAHSEMYFDCKATWGECKGDAMWTLAWRARLRRVQPFGTLVRKGIETALVGTITKALAAGITTRIEAVDDGSLMYRAFPNIKDSWAYRDLEESIQKLLYGVEDKVRDHTSGHSRSDHVH